jgi:hypothetical protein
VNDVDYYELLGVDSDADETTIKGAYRALVKQTHPDAGGNAALFRLVEQAYQTLSDPVRRRAYDRARTAGWMPGLDNDDQSDAAGGADATTSERRDPNDEPGDESAGGHDRDGGASWDSVDDAEEAIRRLVERLAQAGVHVDASELRGRHGTTAETEEVGGSKKVVREQRGRRHGGDGVKDTGRWVWRLRCNVVVFALLCGLAWHLSRVAQLPRRFGADSPVVEWLEILAGGTLRPLPVLVAAIGVAGALLWQDMWRFLAVLPAGAGRWAGAGAVLGVGAVAEAVPSVGAIVVIALTSAGFAAVGWRRSRHDVVSWDLPRSAPQ